MDATSGHITLSLARPKVSRHRRWSRWAVTWGGAFSAVEWDPFELAALTAVDETADEGAVTDATWSNLAQRLDSGELVEFLMLIAHYIMLSTVLRSLRVQLEPSAAAQAEGVAGGPPA